MKNSLETLASKSHQYRKRFLEIFTRLGYGHVTSAFSWTEIATVLYSEILENQGFIKPEKSKDKIVVSKGHGVGMLFPIFEDFGFFTKEEIDEIVKVGGSNEKLRKLFYPGFDFYGGSLGIGLGVASGLAKAAKVGNLPYKTYCLVGDAECYEGSIWESINFASHNKLDNLTVIVDRNNLGCSDFTEHMLALEPFTEKWRAFNWEVNEIDGHNLQEVYDSLFAAKNANNGKPQCIIAHTKKGQGLDYLIDKPLMHGFVPKGAEIDRAFKELK